LFKLTILAVSAADKYAIIEDDYDAAAAAVDDVDDAAAAAADDDDDDTNDDDASGDASADGVQVSMNSVRYDINI
jgi:hypothetical protein